jgi:pyruvate kinase
MRRTRILSTIGPASESDAGIRALIDAGTDAFRLNFSHGSRDQHAAACRRIRAAATEAGRFIAVLQDLSGPKIRIGAVAAPIALATGDRLTIELGDFRGGKGRVSCTFEALFTSVPVRTRLLLDDGRIELETTKVGKTSIETQVITGGTLESHKGINVPGVALKTEAMTAKDEEDLAAGVAMAVDIVAVSFVQTADDIRRVRAAADRLGAGSLPLVAKIEKPQAVERLDEILDVTDGLMVARGDLGIELPLETIPAVQKRIVQAARRRGAPVIVATQVLESMRTAPRPTRAEVTDAAHVVAEGADAVMLAGETAVGEYSALAVSTLDRILREAEKSPAEAVAPDVAAGWTEHGRALCEAAVALASRAGADAIVALTGGGRTARMLAALRPSARILAVTPNAETAARLSLVWGVTPIVAPAAPVGDVRALLASQGFAATGSAVVFVSMASELGGPDANFVHIERI